VGVVEGGGEVGRGGGGWWCRRHGVVVGGGGRVEAGGERGRMAVVGFGHFLLGVSF
jgi:hypothetical protein